MVTHFPRTFREYLDEERRRRRIAQGLPPEPPLPPMPGLLAVPTGTSEPPPVPFIYGPNDPRGIQERAFTPTDIPGVQRLVDILAPETIPYGPFKGRRNPSRVLGAAFTTVDPDIAARLQQEPAILKVLMGLPVGAPVRSIAGTAGRGVLTQTGRAATQAARQAAPAVRRLATEQAGAIRPITPGISRPATPKPVEIPGMLGEPARPLTKPGVSRPLTPRPTKALTELQVMQERLALAEGQLDALATGSGLVRPPKTAPGGIGLWSNARLQALAKQERLNPYQGDWWDSVDPVVVKEVRLNPIHPEPTITSTQREIRGLRRDIVSLQRETSSAQVAAGQAEMPITKPAAPVTERVLPNSLSEAIPVQTLPQAPVGAEPPIITPGQASTGARVAAAQGDLLPGAAAPPIKPPIEPPVETEDVLRIARSGTGDIPPVEEARPTFAQAADPSGAPPGRVPPVRRARRPAPGPEPEGVLEAVTRQATRGERLDQTLLRRHEAAITTAENEARVFVDEGVQRFRAAKLGVIRTGRWVPREQDVPVMDELFEALHNPSKVASGEMRTPAGLEKDYTRLRELTNWEEAMRIDFDSEMATVEDYFYRGWLMPKEGVPKAAAGVPRGRLGAVPAFKKPRVNATYREMRNLGFEPISWNPYEQWRISRLQGVRYREQMQLIDHLKKLDLATTDAAGLGAEGWRTPRVGPAFEGKVFATTDAAGSPVPMYTRRWVVPDDLAGSLESMYGVAPRLGNVHVGRRTIDLMKAIDAVVFIPKRAKLFGSLFQQFDFLMRNYIGAWSGMVDALAAGQPIEAVRRLAIWPKSATDIVRANLRPGFRASLRQQLNSTAPLIKGRPGVHMRGIMEGGLSTIDTTILPRNLDKTARVVAEEAGLLGNKAVGRALGSIESSMRRGLFEGVYPAAQITDIKNNIAPMIARRYGSLSDEALNGMIAQVTNKKYSTIPASQSILQSRPLREILRRLFFSISETEGLLRQATSAIRGPQAGYWRAHYIGAYLGLIALANVIHFASTGEPLPWGRWTPVSKDKWGILPVGYNQKFAAPDLPIRGTEGRNITLDVVGQLDTAFRILDPVSFLAARESVPIRASVTQLTERDYFGRPITDVGPGGIYSRTANLANDLFAPIGIGQAAGQIALREAGLPKGLIPMSERGLTTTGQLIQATGLNVRAQYLRELWETDLKPYGDIPSNDRERLAKFRGSKTPQERLQYSLSRDKYRARYPEVDAKLFIMGQTTSLQSLEARRIVVQLMKENRIDVKDIKSLEEEQYEPWSRTTLRRWFEQQLGTPGVERWPHKPVAGARGLSGFIRYPSPTGAR